MKIRVERFHVMQICWGNRRRKKKLKVVHPNLIKERRKSINAFQRDLARKIRIQFIGYFLLKKAQPKLNLDKNCKQINKTKSEKRQCVLKIPSVWHFRQNWPFQWIWLAYHHLTPSSLPYFATKDFCQNYSTLKMIPWSITKILYLCILFLSCSHTVT